MLCPLALRGCLTGVCVSRVLLPNTGQLETPDDEVLCVMDVLEEVGDDVARRCYWDFGDWSDLWRETKHVPSGVNLQVGCRVLKEAHNVYVVSHSWPALSARHRLACSLAGMRTGMVHRDSPFCVCRAAGGDGRK
jgi:hypothetical protein